MAEHQPSKNNGKQKGRRRLGKRLSPVTKRILALILTGVFLCSGVVLVVYRDHFNLDALKRHMTYRSLEKNDQGQTAEFTYTRDASNASPASTAPWSCAQTPRCSYIPTVVCCILIDR